MRTGLPRGLMFAAMLMVVLNVAGCTTQATEEPNRPGYVPRGSTRLSARQVRDHAQVMADIVARADTIRVYAYVPKNLESPHPELAWAKLGEVRRVEDDRQWQRMVEAVRAARKDYVLRDAGWLKLELVEGGKQLAVAGFLPPDGEIGMRLGEREYGRVWVGSAMREIFQAYKDEAHKRLLGMHQPMAESQPPPAPVRAVAPPPAPAEFSVVKARVVELFRNAHFANIGRHEWTTGVRGAEPRGKHRQAWRLMTQGIEEANPGWPTRAPAEVMIRPMLREPPEWSALPSFDLYYIGGILYSEEPELGAGKHTLKPSPKFERGLQVLLRTATQVKDE